MGMINIIRSGTRCASSVIACAAMLLATLSPSSQATVTWDGTEGVNLKVFSAECTGCHYADNDYYGPGVGIPNFEDYATAASYITSIIDRINRAPTGDSSLMPQGGPKLNNGLLALMAQWQTDGTPKNATPSVVTNPANTISKTQATAQGTVNANGLATTYWFQWGLDDGGGNFPNETTHLSTANTNGGLTPQSVNAVLTGLTCGTDYQFRAAAINADNTPNVPSTGTVRYFSAGSCSFPTVEFGGAQVAGVGDTVSMPLALSGDGSTDYQYPVTMNYTVTGTASTGNVTLSGSGVTVDTNAQTISIASGFGGSLNMQINGNAQAPANASAIVSLTAVSTANATLPDPSEFTVVISGNGTAPVIPLHVTQADNQGRHSQYLYKNLGDVTVTADVGGISASYNWAMTDSELLDASLSTSGNTFSFDITDAGIVPGNYTIKVTVTDGQVVTHHATTVTVAATAPVLSCGVSDDANGNGICDATEGLGDFDGDGLPDYLDPTGDPTLLNKRVSGAGPHLTRLITTTSGLGLALGDDAVRAVGSGDATGARIAAGQVASDTDYAVMSGVYDFQVRGLTPGQMARVVIPLEKAMPANAVYRKLVNNAWTNFVVSGQDAIASAASVNNACPAPGSAAYVSGLTAFHDCVQLSLTDGGPNDADGEANGVIRDPGAVTISTVPVDNSKPIPTSSPGGAGSIDWLWLLMLTSLLCLRSRYR